MAIGSSSNISMGRLYNSTASGFSLKPASAVYASAMTMKEKLVAVYTSIDEKFFEQFEFRLRETNLRKLAVYLHKPKDASSLAVTRILFGIAMLFDIPDERGGAVLMERWGNSSTCHFPLLDFIQPLPMPHMALVFAALWLGALGIALGYKFRTSAITFTVSYWYLLLVEKSYWNNHSYLFGLVGFLLSFTRANCYWSLDAYLDPSIFSPTVPYWNYFLLKYQFFILYFMAGVKKGTAEWLTGYSVQNLSDHWLFNPFKLFLTVSQTDYLVVHWFVFAFDLTVAGWMMWSRSRHLAMLFCALFHLMNSRLFRIGMFPWVCLATMPLFYPFDWPKLVLEHFVKAYKNAKARIYKYKCMVQICKSSQAASHKDTSNKDNNEETETEVEKTSDERTDRSKNIAVDEIVKTTDQNDTGARNDDKTGSSNVSESDLNDIEALNERKRIITCILIGVYVFIQGFLPFSHFITKGYNNWTNGLYGYSWDMMVHTWDVDSVVVKVVDNESDIQLYIDPHHFTPNDRWSRHGDMVHQYARCIKRNMIKDSRKWNHSDKYISNNISIYLDVWASLNGRFIQRMFDPKVDLLNVSWSPFTPVSYLMPLLDEGLSWREHLLSLRENTLSWNNNSDVIFIADFPGYEYEKYVPEELRNVTLTVLDGLVVYESEMSPNQIGKSYQLRTGDWMNLDSGIFHKIVNVGEMPAFYMYTFYNISAVDNPEFKSPPPKLPIATELRRRFNNMGKFAKNIIISIIQLLSTVSQCC